MLVRLLASGFGFFILVVAAFSVCLPVAARELPAGDWKKHDAGFDYRVQGRTPIKMVGKRHLEVTSGAILINARRPTTVSTPLASIALSRGALVLVRVDKKSTRCFVVHDSEHPSVKLTARKRVIGLGPGQEAFVTAYEPKYRQLLEQDDIGRRRVRVIELGDDYHVATCEYSLMQALERDPLLKQVSHSEAGRDRALKNKILKTAAVLSRVQIHHGSYSGGTRF